MSLLSKYQDKLRLFLDYMLDTWIEEPRSPINVWNHWSHIETRTSTAKISFLESDKSIQSIDKLLGSLRDLVPKFIKK